jgi:hypothetical protein
MAFIVQYFSRERKVWESAWSLDIPPSCRQVTSAMAIHDADRAVILDDNGFELVVEQRRRYDA